MSLDDFDKTENNYYDKYKMQTMRISEIKLTNKL